MRFEAASETVWEAYPASLTEIAVAITELGSAEAAVVILAVLFWTTRRHETALVVSYALAGGVLVLAVKTFLAMPRPPEELALISGGRDDPYGFPSGHAFFAVVLYGGLLVTFEKLEQTVYVAGVALLVVLISLSRIVLRVHYIGDILAGAALGLAFLAVMYVVTGESLRRGFAIATGLGVVTIALSVDPVQLLADDVVGDLWLILGLAVGGLLGAGELDRIPPLRSRLEATVLTVVGLAWIVAVMAIGTALVPDGSPAAGVVGAVMIAGIFVLPALVGRIDLAVLERGGVGPA